MSCHIMVNHLIIINQRLWLYKLKTILNNLNRKLIRCFSWFSIYMKWGVFEIFYGEGIGLEVENIFLRHIGDQLL
jgi:hypothetical protein